MEHIIDAYAPLGRLKTYLAVAYNLKIDPSGDVLPPRRKKTYGLETNTLMLMAAWEVMTQTSVQYPNKFLPGGLFGERPAYDDGYFIFLMLNICSGVKERATAETAIKKTLAHRKQVAGGRVHLVHLKLKQEFCRKWDALAPK